MAAKANDKLPLRELMWGTPGSMLACVFMAQMTREPRWRALYVSQAARLLGELQEAAEGALWVQDLYGRQSKYLGAVHGYAGNMIPLLRGWAWLDDVQKQIIDSTGARTLALNAWHSDQGAAWSAYAPRDKPPMCTK